MRYGSTTLIHSMPSASEERLYHGVFVLRTSGPEGRGLGERRDAPPVGFGTKSRRRGNFEHLWPYKAAADVDFSAITFYFSEIFVGDRSYRRPHNQTVLWGPDPRTPRRSLHMAAVDN